jgi:hypothetical protein
MPDTACRYKAETGLASREAPDARDLYRMHLGAHRALSPGAQYLIFWKPGVIKWVVYDAPTTPFRLVGYYTVGDTEPCPPA